MLDFIAKLIPWITKYRKYAREIYAYATTLQMVGSYTKAMLEIMRDGKITDSEGQQVVIMIKALRERIAIMESGLNSMFPAVKERVNRHD